VELRETLKAKRSALKSDDLTRPPAERPQDNAYPARHARRLIPHYEKICGHPPTLNRTLFLTTPRLLLSQRKESDGSC
jgi:hypothetical protein